MDTTFILYFVVPVGLGTIFLIVGGLLIYIGSRKSKTLAEENTTGWLMTGGKVLAVRIEEHETRHNDKSGLHIDITYEPVVEYEYNVNNVEYRGNNVFPGQCENLEQKIAQEFIDKYPVNSYAPVRYNPEEPSSSSLEEHGFHKPNRVLLSGQILLVFGICVCCFTSFMLFIVTGKVL